MNFFLEEEVVGDGIMKADASFIRVVDVSRKKKKSTAEQKRRRRQLIRRIIVVSWCLKASLTVSNLCAFACENNMFIAIAIRHRQVEGEVKKGGTLRQNARILAV